MRRDRLRLIQGLIQKTSETTRSLPSPTSQFTPLKHSPPQSSGDLTLALRASEQRLSALLEDRGRIGRDLHDCVLQSLYAIGLNLEQSRRLTLNVSRASRSSGDRVVAQLNNLIQDIRRMIHGLEYGSVEEFDLASELRVLVGTYAQVGNLQIITKLRPAALEILTGEEEREILNIVREALSNCVRHAHASQATVTLQMRGSRVRLVIGDDGVGFDSNKHQFAGYGLANMNARARKLGGTLRIRSKMGRGTHIIAEFSLEPILAPA